MDGKKEPLTSAEIRVYQGDILKGGSITDYEGNFVIRPLPAGYYELTATHSGYKEIKVLQVLVDNGAGTTVNLWAEKIRGNDSAAVIKTYTSPLINHDHTEIMVRGGAEPMFTGEITDVVSTTIGVYQSQRGKDIHIPEQGRDIPVLPKIYGRITDENQAIPGVTLKLFKKKDPIQLISPDSHGYYSFNDIPKGKYKIIVSDDEFHTKIIRNIRVDETKSHKLDIILKRRDKR